MEELKLVGKGFGGGITTLVMAFVSLRTANEFVQFGLTVGGCIVLAWSIKQLATASAKNQAETASAIAERHLKEVEIAKLMMGICVECRLGKVPVQCPLPPEQRPQDCPRKDA